MLMSGLDPEGAKRRRQRKLDRRVYQNKVCKLISDSHLY